MTTETETNRGRFFVTSLLPWLVAGGMLLVYLLTLNHSPSTNNIYHIADLSGWYTSRRYFAPVIFLLTYPLRWLPVAFIGTGLNLFTLGCAALTLGLLARSVALLPHDRTYDQRQRELSDFSLLTIPAAWLPPLFAALVCGLQMTFWENSVNTAGETRNLRIFSTDASGEMLDLLLFAYSIRCLLEYRVTMKVSWMARFAFVYGLGMADNWLMVGLFPGFLAAVVWIRGLSVFNTRFLGMMTASGLAGLSLILMFPILTGLAHLPGFGFWQALHYVLRTDKSIISAFPADLILLLSLTSLLPVFVIGIRWASSFGDSSQIGIFLATFTFYVVHALFLLACIWVAFDPPVSPRQKGYDFPFLPLYYLGALSIGYFAGYFLLVFGTRPPKERTPPHPLMRIISLGVTLCIWLLALTVPVFQVWKNLPQIRAHEAADAALARLSSLTATFLPPQGAVVLSDDQLRLSLLQGVLSPNPEKTNLLLINTAFLSHDPFYIRSLEKKYPGFNLAGSLTNWASPPSDFELIHFLENLAQRHDVYYIHPSFGYYLERFYMVPRRLLYQLKEYDTNTWTKPPLSTEQIEENQKFWENLAQTELPVLTNLIYLPIRPVSSPILRYIMDTGHLTIESNKPAVLVSSYYARSLDYWGVELEKSGLLPEAAKCFAEALQFNPDSVSARVNSQFNQTLRSGKKIVVERPAAIRDKFGKYRGWTDLLNADGPFDEPGFCYVLGETFAAGENYHEGTPPPQGYGNYLQAIQEFERVRALAPDYPDAAYWLCELFLRFGKTSEALSYAEQVLQRTPDDPNALLYKAAALMQLGSSSEALSSVEQVLQRTPDDPKALFYKSIYLMQLGAYEKAIPPLDRLLTLQTSNYGALLDRAICHLQLHDYPAARTDYETLDKVSPRNYRVDYGLQEVAYHLKDTNAVIKYCQLYLTNYYQYFPTNRPPPETDEIKLIKQRLKDPQNGAP